MTRYLVLRIGQAMITILLVSIAVFAGVRALPGDPAQVLSGGETDPETIKQIREQFGLDRPIFVQYLDYVGNALHGDLGRSARTGAPVSKIIASVLPVTIELAILAVIVAMAIGICAGVLAAARKGRPAEWLANGIALLGLSIPSFWLALMAVLLFSIVLPILPSSGFVAFGTDPLDNLRRMILPALVLGAALAAVLMRQTRSAMLEALTSDYVRTAQAKGLSERKVLVGHALRNSLVTVTTVLGLQLGHLISGAVVTESIFVLPGLGKATIDAVLSRDYALIQGVVLVTATGYVVVNLLVDLLYPVIDPRIRIRP